MRHAIMSLATCLLLASAADVRAFEIREMFGDLFGGEETEAIPEWEGVKLVEWADLTPPLSEDAKWAIEQLNARIDMMTDEEIARAMAQIDENGYELIEELDGEVISIKGFLVPLDFEATEATDFVLVPYKGACIHVPPPPPNQIIFVSYEKGIKMETIERNLYQPFRVTGKLRAMHARTEIAETGYQLTADRIGMVNL